MRYIDENGKQTMDYPFNPNGSPAGITSVTTEDGRFTIMMPHPERVFRSIQQSYECISGNEDSPWMKFFINARKWLL